MCTNSSKSISSSPFSSTSRIKFTHSSLSSPCSFPITSANSSAEMVPDPSLSNLLNACLNFSSCRYTFSSRVAAKNSKYHTFAYLCSSQSHSCQCRSTASSASHSSDPSPYSSHFTARTATGSHRCSGPSPGTLLSGAGSPLSCTEMRS